MEVFQVFLANTYRVRFLQGLGQSEEHFKRAAAAAKGARVSRVTRPRHPFLLDELVELVAKDLA